MAQVTFTIKDTKIVEAEDAIAGLYGYQVTLADGTPNTETKTQFMRKQIKAWVKNQMIEHRNRQALEAAALVDSDI